MFGYVRRSELEAFRREIAKELVALRKTIDQLAGAARLAPDVAAQETKPAGTTIELPGSGSGFPIAVVGESYREAALKLFAGDRRSRGEEVVFSVALVPDPSNAYDANAIKVHIHGGALIGFLSKSDAVEYADLAKYLVAANAVGLCRARIIGGTLGKPSLGVQLDLAEPMVVAAALTASNSSQPF